MIADRIKERLLAAAPQNMVAAYTCVRMASNSLYTQSDEPIT